MDDAERDFETVQRIQGRALWSSPLPLPSARLTLATGNLIEDTLAGGVFIA